MIKSLVYARGTAERKAPSWYLDPHCLLCTNRGEDPPCAIAGSWRRGAQRAGPVPRRWQRFTAVSGPGGRWIVSHMGAFYIIRIMEREAAESAAARGPRVPSRRPDDHAALDAIRSNPSIVRRVFAAMRHSTDGAPGGAGRGRRRLGRAARAH